MVKLYCWGKALINFVPRALPLKGKFGLLFHYKSCLVPRSSSSVWARLGLSRIFQYYFSHEGILKDRIGLHLFSYLWLGRGGSTRIQKYEGGVKKAVWIPLGYSASKGLMLCFRSDTSYGWERFLATPTKQLSIHSIFFAINFCFPVSWHRIK